MVKLTKIVTKTGDKGTTKIGAGKSIPKTSCRIQALGEIDELNAFLGLVFNALTINQNFPTLKKSLTRIQNELFDLGAQLAVLIEDRRENTPSIKSEDIIRLEDEIYSMNETLPILNSFVIPQEGEVPIYLHIARTVCRRAERSVALLGENEKLDGVEIPYLNRLSDWLFVAARYVTIKSNITEVLWEPGRRDF